MLARDGTLASSVVARCSSLIQHIPSVGFVDTNAHVLIIERVQINVVV